MKKISYFIFMLLGVFMLNEKVYAATYTPSNNLFSNSQSDNLLDMANSQIDNFYNKKFVIFQVDNNYYLVAGNDYTSTETSITFTDSIIISATRYEGGYYSNYNYSTFTEASTRINLNYIVISNIKSNKSVNSDKFNEFQFQKNMINIGIFVLGLVFALFLTKERRY